MGTLVLFLHAHLPFVRHPDRPGALEEDWLFQAVADVYLPLTELFDAWWRDRVPVRITMSMTPTLASMLSDEMLQRRTELRLERLHQLARLEARRMGDTTVGPIARMYRDRLEVRHTRYRETYARDLLGAFTEFQSRGQLELVASAATHAHLPLLGADPSYARAQIRVGRRYHADVFKRPSDGFWLPECAYTPMIGELLAAEGVRYTLVDTHAFENAQPPAHPLSPIRSPEGLAVFARDPACAQQVWSAESGYPADGRYRDRYRDWGYDLPADELHDLRLPNGERRPLGLGYHAVTGAGVPLSEKIFYDRLAAMDAIESHADHFVRSRRATVEHAPHAIMVAPYDAELFGHWWFEGPEFLNRVVRKVAEDSALVTATPNDVLDRGPRLEEVSPASSSWGRGGHAEVWLNESNDWIWPKLHDAARTMRRVASERQRAEGRERRALRQLGRELLLASASDWPFILTEKTVTSYARARVETHLSRFERLHADIVTGAVDDTSLATLEAEDNIFPDLVVDDFI